MHYYNKSKCFDELENKRLENLKQYMKKFEQEEKI